MTSLTISPRVKINNKHFALLLGLIAFAVLLLLWQFPQDLQTSSEISNFSSGSLAFIANQGQLDANVAFEVKNGDNTIAFTPEEIVFQFLTNEGEPVLPDINNADSFQLQELRLSFLGANPTPELAAGTPLNGKFNYLQGSNPEKWFMGLTGYSDISYLNLYPGVDLHYEGVEGLLKSTFTVHPGTSPSVIHWKYTGAQNISVNENGDLLITLPDGTVMTEKAPLAWQDTLAGKRVPVEVSYIIHEETVGISATGYDPAFPLTIDPTIIYTTILNVTDFDYGLDIQVDGVGNTYVVSYNYDGDFDIMAVKFDIDGNMDWTTFFETTGFDWNSSIAIDSIGNAYVTGYTGAMDFPVMNPIQATKNGPSDSFLVKLASGDGSLLFGTYLGGSRNEEGYDVIVGANDDVYLTGDTDSADFPVTANAVQSGLNLTYCFCDDAYVTRISADNSTIVYSTYLGGGFKDQGKALGLDANNNIYLAGYTESNDFPTVSPIQATYGGGDSDVFAAKISADGNTLAYSTYLGGTDYDWIFSIAVDIAGYAHLVGKTRSANFPTTPGAFQENYVGGLCGTPPFDQHNCEAGYITKINPDGSAFAFSTYLSGSYDDESTGVALDSAGKVYVVGSNSSPDFPPGNPGNSTLYLSRLSSDGSTLNYTEFIDSVFPAAGGVAIDSQNDIYFTGAIHTPPDILLIKFEGDTPPATITPTPTLVPPTETPTQTPTTTVTPTMTVAPPTETPTPTPTATEIPPNPEYKIFLPLLFEN